MAAAAAGRRQEAGYLLEFPLRLSIGSCQPCTVDCMKSWTLFRFEWMRNVGVHGESCWSPCAHRSPLLAQNFDLNLISKGIRRRVRRGWVSIETAFDGRPDGYPGGGLVAHGVLMGDVRRRSRYRNSSPPAVPPNARTFCGPGQLPPDPGAAGSATHYPSPMSTPSRHPP